MSSDMKVKAVAPWFGSKRILAPVIARELGRPKQFFDPFCGSLAVPLAMEPCHHETVSDLHGDVICLARVVADELLAPRLYARLSGTICTEDLLEQSRTMLSRVPLYVPDVGATGDMCDRAYWYFCASWLSRNGCAGQERTSWQMAVRWTPGGGAQATRFRNTVESIPAWHRRLLNMTILCRDAFDIIPRVEDAAHTAIYCDPPYIKTSRTGHRSGGNSSRYLHDFDDYQAALWGDHHQQLAEQLRSFKQARIVVSYYDCPRVRELYAGWTFVDKTRAKHLHQQNKRGIGKQEAPELLIINGPSYTE